MNNRVGLVTVYLREISMIEHQCIYEKCFQMENKFKNRSGTHLQNHSETVE